MLQHEGTAELRILLIDDHPLFCDAMAMTVGEIFDNPRVATASTLKESLDMVGPVDPDLVVLDLNLPDVDGVDGLIRLRAAAPDAKIVVVSSLSDNRVTTSVLDSGAVGFVPKSSPRDELVRAFQAIADGEIYTPDDFIAPQNNRLNQESQQIVEKLKSLTPQQATILNLICEGKLNKQIAFDLSIAETTVKAHLTAIMRKLGVQNRTQAVLLAKKVSYDSLSDGGET
ncbi:response regulator [Actibacterium ureilyticum]|uniref:response regulator n=1 Tax=Actibacterium ureilyticum TaxID=1590614 RepID=UPI001FEB1FBF|nr:response regulator transcription factor [Actibacterium ureilyticum]